jgi:hypothetical protein
MLDRVVWRPVGKSTAVGLHMSLAKLKLRIKKPKYCDIKLDTYTYCNTMHGTMNLK